MKSDVSRLDWRATPLGQRHLRKVRRLWVLQQYYLSSVPCGWIHENSIRALTRQNRYGSSAATLISAKFHRGLMFCFFMPRFQPRFLTLIYCMLLLGLCGMWTARRAWVGRPEARLLLASLPFAFSRARQFMLLTPCTKWWIFLSLCRHWGLNRLAECSQSDSASRSCGT